MALPFGAFLALDALAAALTLAVVGFFALAWRRTRAPLHLLFATGFGLVALGFLAVSTSEFDLAREAEAWDAWRLASQTCGALVLLFGYLSARRHGAARPLQAVGWAVAAVAVLVLLLYLVVPPTAELPRLDQAFVAAHLVQFLAYVGCVALSLEAYRRLPTAPNALVPAAFLAWSFSKYTWLLIDLSAAHALVPLVFVWRFSAIALLVTAIALPVRRGAPEVADAPA